MKVRFHYVNDNLRHIDRVVVSLPRVDDVIVWHHEDDSSECCLVVQVLHAYEDRAWYTQHAASGFGDTIHVTLRPVPREQLVPDDGKNLHNVSHEANQANEATVTLQ